MQYTVVISDEASFDILEAHYWYQIISEKLADTLEKEIDSLFLHLAKNPNQFQLKHKTVRVVFLKKFPYGIHYIINEEVIQIIALFHTSRDPSNWEERLK